MKHFISLIATLSFSIAGSLAHAQTYEHGQANMGIALEGNALVIAFSSPLFNLVGFENMPSTDWERQTMRQMRSTLNNASAWFIPNPEAGCLIEAVDHQTSYIEKAGEPQKAVLEARIELACSNPGELYRIEIPIFQQFHRIEKVQVFLEGAGQQIETEITPYNYVVQWYSNLPQ